MKKTNKDNNTKTKKKMKKRFKIPLITLGVLLGIVVLLAGVMFFKMQQQGVNLLTGERVNAEELNAVNASADMFELDETSQFTEKDLQQTVDLSEAKVLSLTDGEDMVISEEGTYILSGSYTDTMVVVEADDKAKVQLVLEDLEVVNTSKPVIYVKSADKVFITSTDTYNNLEVTKAYDADGETNLDAVIFSRSDLVLNGQGVVDIRSEKGNGVSSKDDLKITGGTYNIVSLKNALEANDSIRVADGELNLTSANDAIHSENEEDDSKGYIFIEGGIINISAGDDAIRGNSAVIINGGDINIESSAEGIEATQIIINDGEIDLYAIDDGINATPKTSHRVLAQFNGGVVNVEMSSGDTDGIDSNGDFTMNGGEIHVVGGMAAFDIDGVIEWNDGDVTVDGVVQTEIVIQSFGGIGPFKKN